MSADKKHNLAGALLLNALIMPGSGHYAMGFRLRGTIIMSSILILVILPIVLFTGRVLGAIHGAMNGSGPMVRSVSAFSGSWHALRGFILFCVAAIVAIWIYSIVDMAIKMRKEKTLMKG
ncbi:MAG: hypothetical protein WC690_03905 [bacterium]